MDNTQLNRLLNTACEIIMSLEHHADTYTANKIEVLFQEIKYSDNLDEEIEPEYDGAGFTEDDRIVNGQYINLDADMEAQDWETFKENKI